jgi:hypothetical protein
MEEEKRGTRGRSSSREGQSNNQQGNDRSGGNAQRVYEARKKPVRR